jgi:3alpha(or 20beta)-hydroxysteroid dehydrogenase
MGTPTSSTDEGARGGSLAGRIALVTGAARGQGECIARRFVAEGASVVLTDVLDDVGMAVASSLGPAAMYRRLDVTSEDEWNAAVAAAVERFGRLDALVNNAGIMQAAPITETSPEQFRTVMDVNAFGVFLGMRAAIPAMRAAGGGTIVNTSSVGGLIGLAGLSAYTASKFAVRGLTRTVAMEVARDHIRVNAVVPGRIDSMMSNPAGGPPNTRGIPLGRVGSVDEVAAAVLYLTSDASAFCTGTELILDGGATAGVTTEEQ